jgi:hypothetical protein
MEKAVYIRSVTTCLIHSQGRRRSGISRLGWPGHGIRFGDTTTSAFSTIDLEYRAAGEINFGLGVGLTRSTDLLIARMNLGYRFDFFWN